MSFGGLIAEIPAGLNGLNGTKNLSLLGVSDLLSALNLSYADGTMQKEGGAAKYNSSAITGAPAILGGWDWNHNGATQRMVVVTDGGKILKDSGAGTFGTTLATGLTVTDASGDPVAPVFAEGGKEAAANDRKLFIFTGRNQVQVLAADGAATSNLATPPADWTGANQPRFGLVHEGRMWGGGNVNEKYGDEFHSVSTKYRSRGNRVVRTYEPNGRHVLRVVEGNRNLIGLRRLLCNCDCEARPLQFRRKKSKSDVAVLRAALI